MKKEAKEAVRKRLEKEQNEIRGKIRANKYAMKNLVDEQTRLKRELPLLQELIRSLGDK